jgi:hypothetical protein
VEKSDGSYTCSRVSEIYCIRVFSIPESGRPLTRHECRGGYPELRLLEHLNAWDYVPGLEGEDDAKLHLSSRRAAVNEWTAHGGFPGSSVVDWLTWVALTQCMRGVQQAMRSTCPVHHDSSYDHLQAPYCCWKWARTADKSLKRASL